MLPVFSWVSITGMTKIVLYSCALKVTIKCQLGYILIQGLHHEIISFLALAEFRQNLSPHSCVRSWLFLAVDQRLPSSPKSHLQSHSMVKASQTWLLNSSQVRKSFMMQHHYGGDIQHVGHTLLVKSSLQGLPGLEERRSHTSVNIWSGTHWESLLGLSTTLIYIDNLQKYADSIISAFLIKEWIKTYAK